MNKRSFVKPKMSNLVHYSVVVSKCAYFGFFPRSSYLFFISNLISLGFEYHCDLKARVGCF